MFVFLTGMGGMGGAPGGLIKYGGLIKASLPTHNPAPYSANSGTYFSLALFLVFFCEFFGLQSAAAARDGNSHFQLHPVSSSRVPLLPPTLF